VSPWKTYSRQLPDLSDDQIRHGASVTIPVGGYVGAGLYGRPRLIRGLSLRGVLDGTSLRLKDLPGAVSHHRWKAVRPGTTRLALYVVDHGQRTRLGMVTVIVEPRPDR
jgi:hypothetical protein